jgi:cobalamin biosynthesis Mg chelatase CobN
MANAQGTGKRPSTSSSNTPPNTSRDTPGVAGSEVDTINGRVTVYDSDSTTTPTGAATTTPGTWRTAEDDSELHGTRIHSDPAPARRSGSSLMTTIIALIVIVLIAYFILQLLF